MKKYLLLGLAAATLFTACKKEEANTPQAPKGITRVTAGVEATRAQIIGGETANEGDRVIWKAGDVIRFRELVPDGNGGYWLAEQAAAGVLTDYTEFVLVSDPGTASGEFELVGSVGLDPTKKYFAYHGGHSKIYTDVAKYLTAASQSLAGASLRLGLDCSALATSTSTGRDTYCEQVLTFIAPVIFEGESGAETVAPLVFKPYGATILELRIKLAEDVDLTGGSYLLGKITWQHLNLGTEVPCNAFNNGAIYKFDANLTPVAAKDITGATKSVASILYKTGTPNPRFTLSTEETVARWPTTPRPANLAPDARNSRTIKITLELIQGATTKYYVTTFDRIVEAGEPTLAHGQTYFKKITINQADILTALP